MAITFRASASNTNDTGTSISVNKPAGTVDGDLIFVVYCSDATGATLSPPDGTWNEVTSGYTGEDQMTTRAWWKTARSEPTSWTFTSSSSNRNAIISGSFYDSVSVNDWQKEDDSWNWADATSITSTSVTGVAN